MLTSDENFVINPLGSAHKKCDVRLKRSRSHACGPLDPSLWFEPN